VKFVVGSGALSVESLATELRMRNGESTLSEYDHLPIRALQTVGAIALARYCDSRDIRHDAIDSLVDHLYELARMDDFPEWETQLMKLPLHGLGDLPPLHTVAKLPSPVRGEFYQLVENVVEITMSIAYGKVTDEPAMHLKTVLLIAAHSGVLLPAARDFEIAPTSDGFGVVIDDDQYLKWRSFLP
jgi:hypothetical protein